MKKIFIIIQREFLVQIKQKSFIIVTLFTPIFISILFVFLSFIYIYNQDNLLNFYKIGVIDNNSYNLLKLKSYKNILFTFLKNNNESINKEFLLKEIRNFDALLFIPKYKKISSLDNSIHLYLKPNNKIDNIINQITFLLYKKIELIKLKQIGVSKNIINLINHNNLKIQTSYLVNNSSNDNNLSIKLLFISIMMYIIMMFILIYGVRIMRSVFEEKNNRIVEIILSSVKPIQLMIGKILGTGLVALTQFIIWTFFLYIIFLLFQSSLLEDKVFLFKNIIQKVSIINNYLFHSDYFILICIFLIYFLGGYLLFSAIFAAIGSCIEVDSEPQQFSILASIILIIGFYVGISSFNNPNNILVLILSIFPLTSPVVMLSRVSFNIPIWQIFCSIFILFFSVCNVMYLAAKIYSMNILIHNKRSFFKRIK